MQENDAIIIEQVGNGFIVRPAPIPLMMPERALMVGMADVLVFRTMNELAYWLGSHFTHRAQAVAVDKP